jgi:hypothetical protein
MFSDKLTFAGYDKKMLFVEVTKFRVFCIANESEIIVPGLGKRILYLTGDRYSNQHAVQAE